MAAIRCFEEIEDGKFDDEGHITRTSKQQLEVEHTLEEFYYVFSNTQEIDANAPELLRYKHVAFLKNCLSHLPTTYECLDASRPWLCYWILHSLEVLDESLQPEDISNIINFLKRCQCPDGGFAGGPGQYPHLAPTYAAVNALCTLGTIEAYEAIDRKKLLQFLWSVRNPDGSFQMHVNGEVDARGIYCALSVAKLINVYCDELFENSDKWLVSCQTYEGGFAGTPGMEAHGGYGFCSIAALSLLGKEDMCDIESFIRWTANRQMKYEGGFQGRTNKLVDGCYSFWQGGAFPITHLTLLKNNESNCVNVERWLFNQEALQEFILVCCQHSYGGLLDMPNKPRDIYHTCYALSGLSIAQHSIGHKAVIIGNNNNELAPVHPVHNIGIDSYMNATKYFQSLTKV